MTLQANLITAGLPIESATEQGNVVWIPGSVVTPAQSRLCSDMIFQYIDPAGYVDMLAARTRYEAAKLAAKQIPDYSTWTVQEWTDYRNANISATQINAMGSLAEAKPIMVKMSNVLDGLAKMVITLRDHNFPDLPEWIQGLAANQK